MSHLVGRSIGGPCAPRAGDRVSAGLLLFAEHLANWVARRSRGQHSRWCRSHTRSSGRKMLASATWLFRETRNLRCACLGADPAKRSFQTTSFAAALAAQ